MTVVILDGKATAEKIISALKVKVSALRKKPGLGIVTVGNDSSSEIYVSGKVRACERVGMTAKRIVLDEDSTQDDVMNAIDDLNQDRNVQGYIVQLPLPKQIDASLVLDGILPHKDADGFSPINMGNMMAGKNVLLPATPKGIIRLLDEYKIDVSGKHAVVVGRSNIVGKPIALLLQQRNATVTMCHSMTKDLKKMTKQADIIVSAAGKAGIIKANMVKKGAVVIDVGISKEGDTIQGDVDFEKVKKIASYITPVPGGVGPMTVVMLLENTLECYNMSNMID